jgi:hypothetical protein
LRNRVREAADNTVELTSLALQLHALLCSA